MLLLVYKPDTRGRAAPEGGGLINRNNTIKGVIKCLLPVARLRDAFATRARPEMAILRLWSRPEGRLKDGCKVRKSSRTGSRHVRVR